MEPPDDHGTSSGSGDPESPDTPVKSGNPETLALDQLTEQLLARRERLQYFVISAATAILVFTFRDFNNRDGVLSAGPLLLISIAWGLLVAAALAAMFVVRQRHQLSWLYLETRYASNPDNLTAKEKEKRSWLERRIDVGELTMALAFGVGIALLAMSYIVGLTASRPTADKNVKGGCNGMAWTPARHRVRLVKDRRSRSEPGSFRVPD